MAYPRAVRNTIQINSKWENPLTGPLKSEERNMRKFLILAILVLIACLFFTPAIMAVGPKPLHGSSIYRPYIGGEPLDDHPWDVPLSAASNTDHTTHSYETSLFASIMRNPTISMLLSGSQLFGLYIEIISLEDGNTISDKHIIRR